MWAMARRPAADSAAGAEAAATVSLAQDDREPAA